MGSAFGLWASSPQTKRAGVTPTRSRSRGVYFSSWCAEGSRHRRRGFCIIIGGTTIGGVVPDCRLLCKSPGESGAGTAFPARGV